MASVGYLLDTDTCIVLIGERQPSERDRVLERLDGLRDAPVSLSTVTLFELTFGVEFSRHRKQNAAALEEFLLDFEILPFDQAAAARAGRVRAILERRGARIGPMDTLIAGHALSTGKVLVTGNTREFSRVDGLTIEDWSE